MVNKTIYNKEENIITKKVIALWGIANIGKSDTIQKVYNFFCLKFAIKKKEYVRFDKDIRVVFTINGIKIGIESQGDPNSRLEESLKLFVKVGCTIIICATRTRGHTVNLVKSLGKRYEVIWYKQEVKGNSSEYESNNKTVASKLIKEIIKIIN